MSDGALVCSGLRSSRRDSLPVFGFRLRRGALACLTGPMDSGKSLALRLLGGLDEPAAGSLEILGLDVWKLDDAARRELRRRACYVLPNNALQSSADALENLVLPAEYHMTGPDADRERRARALLRWLDCPEECLTTPAAELAPCHRHLVAIARCLMLDPQILFVDDAFGPCAPEARVRLAERFMEMKMRRGITLVLATDDDDLAARHADVLIQLLPHGLRVQDNRPASDPDAFLLLLNPEGVDDYTRAIES